MAPAHLDGGIKRRLSLCLPPSKFPHHDSLFLSVLVGHRSSGPSAFPLLLRDMVPTYSCRTQISAGLAIAVAAYFLSPPLLRKIIVKDGNTLPPGPNVRYAFLGKYPELSVDVWAKQYGPLFSIWMGNQLFVVVSDPRVARDLFVLKGGVISSRKKYFMKNKMILHGRAITASEYGDKWYGVEAFC